MNPVSLVLVDTLLPFKFFGLILASLGNYCSHPSLWKALDSLFHRVSLQYSYLWRVSLLPRGLGPVPLSMGPQPWHSAGYVAKFIKCLLNEDGNSFTAAGAVG